MRSRRRLLTLAAVAVAVLALPAVAQGRSADIVDANVHLRLANDASLLVTEDLTFDYQALIHVVTLACLPQQEPAPSLLSIRHLQPICHI